MRCERLDNRSNRGILLSIEWQLQTLERMMIIMADDFSKLSAAIDTVTSEISAAVAQLQNPAVDNNDQSTIDALTSKLTDAASALSGALPAVAAVAAPAGGDTSGASASIPASGPGSETTGQVDTPITQG